MKKGVLLGLLLVLLCPLLLLVLGLGNASIEAVHDCRNQTDHGLAATEVGVLGTIDGPIGVAVRGKIGVASANIPNRSGLHGFQTSMPEVLSTDPDFVTLNEISGRSLAQIEAAAPGYSAFREAPATGPGSNQSMGNAVLWKDDVWTKRNAGRVKIVEDDKTYYSSRRVTWDRFATWVLLERTSDGAVVSLISTHHMTNPQKFPRQHGNPPLTRAQQYGAGMDLLLQLSDSLATHGPVLIAGDMNSHPGQTNRPWSAAAKMKAAGYGWYHHAVDFVFFPQYQGVTLVRGWTGRMVSDHQWVAARIAMNGAGPEVAAGKMATAGAGAVPALTTSNPAAGTAPSGDVVTQLMRLRFNDSHPTLTREQARNAITIAQVARDLKVPRYGLQVAIATSIQESKLGSLTGGDRDSGGLFQQRPSRGWGSRAQITKPVLAARAFFGRAQHTSNPGLLDNPGWSNMPLPQAAQAVQRSGFPDAYAPWDGVAGYIATLLGGDLPDHGVVSTASSCPQDHTSTPIPQACPTGQGAYRLGPVTAELEQLVDVLGPMFDIETVGGYRESARDPQGHPSGLAADFMVPPTQPGRAQGDRLTAYARAHAQRLGVDYIIWRQRIWSTDRAVEGWRPMQDRGGATENHVDHVHINVKQVGAKAAAGRSGHCDEVVYPVPSQYRGNDARNWHEYSDRRSSWHTGTDIRTPCGTPVYAAHGGTIQVDTTQGWSGPWLVKVTTGAGSLTTWYGHMQKLTVSRGDAVESGQEIGMVGEEGNSSGCHLHFEVHLRNGTIYGPDNADPSAWLDQNVTPKAA